MPSLTVPPEIAMQIQKRNQIYSMAFELFKVQSLREKEMTKDVAKNCISAVKIFLEVVEEDQQVRSN